MTALATKVVNMRSVSFVAGEDAAEAFDAADPMGRSFSLRRLYCSAA